MPHVRLDMDKEELFKNIMIGNPITLYEFEDLIIYDLIDINESVCTGVYRNEASFNIRRKYNVEMHIINGHRSLLMFNHKDGHYPAHPIASLPLTHSHAYFNLVWLKNNALDWYQKVYTNLGPVG